MAPRVEDAPTNADAVPARRERRPRGLPSFGAMAGADRLRSHAERAIAYTRATFEAEMEAGRGFLWLPILFGLGILVYFGLPAEPNATALVAAFAAFAVLAFLRRDRIAQLRVLVALAAIAGGLAATKLRTDFVAAPVLAAERTHRVSGWVVGRERTETGVRLRIRVHEVERLAAENTPAVIRVTVRGGLDIRVGDAVSVLARLSPPSGPVQPGGFDFGRTAFYQRIGTVGFSYGAPGPADIGAAPLGIRLWQPVEDLRMAIARRVSAALPGENGTIAVALIVGERGPIPDEVDEALRDSGLAHVLSISGLHMALVATTAFWALRALLALSAGLALHRPIKKWAAGGALAVATVYLGLSGGGVATERSYIMLAVMLVAVMLDRRALTLRNVALSALVVLVLTPESILSASFQMSFAAVLALVAAYERSVAASDRQLTAAGGLVRRQWRNAVNLALTSLIAGLATAPFAAFHFQRTAPLSVLANLAALPAVSVLVMPMALAAVLVMPFGLELAPLVVMDQGLAWMLLVAREVAGWSESAGLVPMARGSALLAVVAGFLWLAIWSRRWRLAGLVPIVVGVAFAFTGPRPDIVVAADGGGAVVRGADGRYVVLGRPSSYEAEHWLRADADLRAREVKTVPRAACDDLGCAVPLADGRFVALALKREAFEEDCRLAAIVISALDAPGTCEGPDIVIDGAALKRGGSHAIFVESRKGEGTLLRVETAYPAVRRAFMPPVGKE